MIADGKNPVRDFQFARERIDAGREGTFESDQRYDDQISEGDPLERAFLESVLQDLRKEAGIASQCGEAVSDVSHLRDAEDLPQESAVPPVVRDAHERRNVEGISGESSENVGLAGATPDTDNPFATHARESILR